MGVVSTSGWAQVRPEAKVNMETPFHRGVNLTGWFQADSPRQIQFTKFTWRREMELHLILDNHTFDVDAGTDVTVDQVLVPVWTQMAEHHSFAGMQFWFDDIRVTRGTMRNGLRRLLHTRRATNHA